MPTVLGSRPSYALFIQEVPNVHQGVEALLRFGSGTTLAVPAHIERQASQVLFVRRLDDRPKGGCNFLVFESLHPRNERSLGAGLENDG